MEMPSGTMITSRRKENLQQVHFMFPCLVWPSFQVLTEQCLGICQLRGSNMKFFELKDQRPNTCTQILYIQDQCGRYAEKWLGVMGAVAPRHLEEHWLRDQETQTTWQLSLRQRRTNRLCREQNIKHYMINKPTEYKMMIKFQDCLLVEVFTALLTGPTEGLFQCKRVLQTAPPAERYVSCRRQSYLWQWWQPHEG